jgi:hypothetical protein
MQTIAGSEAQPTGKRKARTVYQGNCPSMETELLSQITISGPGGANVSATPPALGCVIDAH